LDEENNLHITVTDQERCKKQVQIEIPADLVRAETDKLASDLARRVRVPGFRPGHVPKSVIKTRFRKELRDEVASQLIPEALRDAVRQREIKLVAEPRLNEMKFGEDESIRATFTIEVAPEFELSNYRGLPLTKRVYKVRDEDVERVIERLREAQAELVPVEDRSAELGDVVVVNLTGRFSGNHRAEQEEVKHQEADIELGAAGLLKEFERALVGARPGDVKNFTVEYPQDYFDETYAGCKVAYTAEVIAIRRKELPELDDEFAKSVNDECKTLAELRAKIRSQLEQRAARRSEQELREAAIQELVDRNRFDVPEAMVSSELDSRMRSLRHDLAKGGINPSRVHVDWEALRESHRQSAERQVRAAFILGRIAEVENIEVSDEDLERELERLAEGINASAATLKARLTKENALDTIKEQVKNHKALDVVIASANIRVEEIEGLGGEDLSSEAQEG
jgi:trigger factor